MNVILYLIGTIGIVEGVVLDPALYLSPSPPLTTTHSNDAEKLWSPNRRNNEKITEITSSSPENTEKTTKLSETMEESETFWPSYRSSSLRGIHIPLTYSLSGTYGGKSGTGVISSGYMRIADGYSLGKTVLAGSGYKSYGRPDIRIYDSDVKPAWGGWGNGKWGHYGKG